MNQELNAISMNTAPTEAPAGPFVVGVTARPVGDIDRVLSESAEWRLGDLLYVNSEHGHYVGRVVELPKPAKPEQRHEKFKVLRKANPADIRQTHEWKEKALESMTLCANKVREQNLPMKLTDADLIEDGKKVLFIFYAENRVDFRNLVKDLSASLRMRVEMRQIGARDETKYKGCLGACGQTTTCCSTFLRNFQSISIGMAKNQGLAPNPTKLTGMCGKLKCCLAYENQQYQEARKTLFKIGSIVDTPEGSGKIYNLDILRQQYVVRLDKGGEGRFAANSCSLLDGAKKVARDRVVTQKQEEERALGAEQRERFEKRQKKFDQIAQASKQKQEQRERHNNRPPQKKQPPPRKKP